MTMLHVTCSKCGEYKLWADFYRTKQDGTDVCKQCLVVTKKTPGKRALVLQRELDTGLRTCTICKADKPLDNYGKLTQGRLGRAATCKQCRSEQTRSKYIPQSNPRACHSHTCKMCSKNYTSSHKRSTFCSPACGQRYRYHQNPQAVKERVRLWEEANRGHHRIQQHNRTSKRRKAVVGKFTSKDWTRLCRRHNYQCAYCGDKPDQLTVEHIVPIARGGSNYIGNIAPACLPCNLEKQDRTTMEWKLWKKNLERTRNLED